MKALEAIKSLAMTRPARIALSDGSDERVVAAAITALRKGYAEPVLIGDRDAIRNRLAQLLPSDRRFYPGELGSMRIEDPMRSGRSDLYVGEFLQISAGKGIDAAAARRMVTSPLGYSAMMVRMGDADGTIGGASATTAETLRTALRIIGKKRDARIISSFFLMMLCVEHHQRKGAFVFADCGLVIEPSPPELAEIALSSAESYERLTGNRAKVAMLSFSTHGSASHARVNHVVEAVRCARLLNPNLIIDGEMQFDTAFVASVANLKAPRSTVPGDANVFIFPNLEAANIGYKIAQRIGGAIAIGPILQGLRKPANDLSRGCSTEDVVDLIAITSVMAMSKPAELDTA